MLSAELAPLSIPVSHLQLGTFDLGSISHTRAPTTSSQRAETLKWDTQSREKYARNFVALSTGSRVGKGSGLRELNDKVFDCIISGRGGTVRIGMGAGLYGFVGRWVPRSLVGWMMGVRRVEEGGSFGEFGNRTVQRAIENGITSHSEGSVSAASSPGGSGGLGVDLQNEGLGESGYVYPHRSDGGFSNRAQE